MQEKEDLLFNEEKHVYTFKGKTVPSVTEICGLLTSSKFASINPSVLMQAQMRGTAVHELTEQIDYDCSPPLEEIDQAIVPYVMAYQQFLTDYSPDWIAVESMLGNEDYAGTIDRVGIVDGHLVIVDLKTTTTMDRLAKMSLCCQLYGYAKLWEAIKGTPINLAKCFGVQLKRDATYTIIDVPESEKRYNFTTEELFPSLLNLTKIIKEGK